MTRDETPPPGPAIADLESSPLTNRILAMLAIAYVIYVAGQIYIVIEAPEYFDPMFLSGATAFLLAIFLASDSRPRLLRALDKLRREGVLPIADGTFRTLLDELRAEARRRARVHAGVVAFAEFAVVLVGAVLLPVLVFESEFIEPAAEGWYPQSIGEIPTTRLLGLFSVAVIAGSVAGAKLGELSAYGAYLNRFGEGDFQLALVPEHGDGFGGAAELWKYVVRQALLAIVPMVWIAVWLALMVVTLVAEAYDLWRLPFLGLFALAVFYSRQALILPMAAVRTAVVRRVRMVQDLRELDTGGDLDEFGPLLKRLEQRWSRLYFLSSGVIYGCIGVVLLSIPAKFLWDANLANLGAAERLLLSVIGSL